MTLNINSATIDREGIEQICQLADDRYRNQWITFVYSKISERLAARTGQNANWFTYARWSSCTVGENLRLDKPSAAFDEFVAGHPLLRLVRGPLIRVQHDLRLMNDAAMPRTLAIGNHMVFHELAWAATEFLNWYETLETPDHKDWLEYRESIETSPPTDIFQDCDVDWLRDGLESYFLAFTAEGDAQARLVLRGNVLLAAYEQWRLEPIVQLALDPVAKHLVEFKDTDLHVDQAAPRAVLRRRGTPWAFRHQSPLLQWVSERYAVFLTKYVMAWEAPIDGVFTAVFLGRGAPESQPRLLGDDPCTLVVQVFDHSNGKPAGRRAKSWVRFTDRMNFIVGLFRALQFDQGLFEEPTRRERRTLDLDLSDENLDELRRMGDAPIDAVVRDHDQGNGADPRALVRRLMVDDFPNAFQVQNELPAWASEERLRVGQQFLCEHGLEIASALFFAALPYSYTAARGSQVLTRTAELTTGHTTRRLAETGQMLLDLMATEERQPLSPGTKSGDAVRGVRMFHAAIRHMILSDTDKAWDVRKLGTPLNQEDLLGTLIVFTVVVVDALERTGVDFSSDEMKQARDDYIHFWLVVGWLLGIDYGELRRGQVEFAPDEPPLDLEELRLIETTILRRQSEPSIGGQTLMASLLASTSSKMPWFMRGFPAAATRSLLGRQYADALAVPPAGPARLLFDAVRVATRFLSPRGPGQGLAVLARTSTKSLYRAWIDDSQGAFPPWRLAAVPNWRLGRVGTEATAPSQNGSHLDVVALEEQEARPAADGSSSTRVD